jgi:hypothetical protein
MNYVLFYFIYMSHTDLECRFISLYAFYTYTLQLLLILRL